MPQEVRQHLELHHRRVLVFEKSRVFCRGEEVGDDVAYKHEHERFSLWVAETYIEFKDIRLSFDQHEADVEDAAVDDFTSFELCE